MTDSLGSDVVRVCVCAQDKDEVLIPLCVDTIPTPKVRECSMFEEELM